MEVKIYLGDANCTTCGRRHKKVFEIDGKPYGSSCANEILGKNLNAPVWLYELAEEWVVDEAKRRKDQIQGDYDYISVNFFNEYETHTNYDGQKLWNKPIKVNGKTVKVDWQYEIHDYLMNRWSELTMTNTKYRPIVPKWVSDILWKEKNQDPLAALGETKRWEEWKRSYSRKLKYARLNGWITEDEENE